MTVSENLLEPIPEPEVFGVDKDREKTLCPSCQTLKGRQETCRCCGCPGERERLARLSKFTRKEPQHE